MGGAVVAVHAIHVVARGFGDLIFGQRGVFRKVLGHAALQILHMNVGNYLAFLIAGDVLNLVADVHVPVNAFRSTGSGIASAGFNQHANLADGVFLIAGVVGEDLKLSAVKLLRPVALLAGILRRAQVV